MKPHPEHRFHWTDPQNPYVEAYDNNLLAQICQNRLGYWSAEDATIALDVLAWRLDYPRR
jgi:hypothetical protein